MSEYGSMEGMTYRDVYSSEVQAKIDKVIADPCPACGVKWGNLPVGHRAFLDHKQPGVWQCETPKHAAERTNP